MTTESDIATLTKQLGIVTANVTVLTQEVVSLKAADAVTQQEIIRLETRASALELSVAALEAAEPPPVEPPIEPPIEPPVEPPPVDPPVDETGWTVLAPSADTRQVFVSDSMGDDANDGLTPQTPVKTIKKGFSLTRWTYPDWLLFRRGDRFRDQQIGWIAGINGGTARSGRSKAEPFVFGDWGDPALPNPVIETKPSTSLGGAFLSQGGGGGGGGNFIALMNIDHYAYTRDPDNPAFDLATTNITHNGIYLLNPIDAMLIEGCDVAFYTGNSIMPGSGLSEVTIRRSKIRNSYASHAHSQGLYTQNVKSLTIEDCWIDHNGWNPKVPGAYRTQYNHGLYHSAVAGTGPVKLVNTVFSRNSNHGSTCNWGGDILDCLYLRNAIGIHLKDRTDGEPSTIKNTVVTESEDRAEDSTPASMGWGITFGDMDAIGIPLSPIVAENVILAHNASPGKNQTGFSFANEPGGITLRDSVIYKWPNPYVSNPAGNTNVIENMLVDVAGTLNLFKDPIRTVATYMGTKGKPATNDALYEALRAQRKGAWRPEFTAASVVDYFQDGFEIRA